MAKGNVVCEVKGSTKDVGVETRNCIDDGLPPNNHHGNKDDLYTELWHSCAGPLVYVPRAGEKVVYFPQGHMEQVEAYMNQDGTMEMPIYNLPSMIICKVVYVQLKAEAATDEVFAQITLLPEPRQDGLSSKDEGNSQPLPRKTYALSFSKKLTSSDTSTHGGFSVLKRHAEECLPPLDMSQDTPEQRLLVKDLHGSEWFFRHVYRGQPKRHLLTTGWSSFVTSKKLVAGDAFIFLRGENAEFLIGVRRALKLQNNVSTTVISAHSMQHGILATAFHAINTGTMFTVYYRPWTSPTEFIVPFDQYIKSAEIDYSVGTRFRMLFEGEECPEQRIERFEGTIVGNEDFDHIRWPNSEWRSLKVKWDPTSDGFARPERVSPWNIEPIEPVKRKRIYLQPPSKRSRLMDASVFPSMVKDGLLHSPVEYAAQNPSEVFQGQEKRDTGVDELGALEPPLISRLIPQNLNSNNKPVGLGNQLHFSVHGPFYPSPSGTVLFPGGNVVRLGLPNCCCPLLSSYGVPENTTRSRDLSVVRVKSYNSAPQDLRTSELKEANEVPHAPQPSGGGRYMLFGVDLVKSPQELPSPQVATYSDHESLYSIPPMSQSSVSKPSKSTSGSKSENQCKNCCSAANQYCTKVLKYGAAGRSVDLTRFDGYEDLICELDQMFDFKGSLIDGSSGWQVTYTDHEEDMMLIGDYPWQEFQRMVRRLFICPKEDTGRLNPKSAN
ncbi:auxin response factor 4 [Hevea brasiliensis]|uniref:auxin response factor 4 n=1 Tax=Hevea brasiliensis TaxID=3981 RepID=UPI0025E0786D|nr:auxin response factor 4 [Hevea brasiliensis]